MKIPAADCPHGFFSRPQDFENSFFVARITKWDQVAHALGKLETLLGDSSDVEVRTRGLLIANGVDSSEFDDRVVGCLPDLPFRIPQTELDKRRDFRKECVFTIDPSTARDLVCNSHIGSQTHSETRTDFVQ